MVRTEDLRPTTLNPLVLLYPFLSGLAPFDEGSSTFAPDPDCPF